MSHVPLANFVSQGHCGPSTELWIVAGSLNIVTDVIVLVLPMPYLIRLEMTMYKKVTLMITFGMETLPQHPIR